MELVRAEGNSFFSESLENYIAPYVPFPHNPDRVQISNLPMLVYINQQKMEEYVGGFVEKIPFGKFEAIAVNNKGGSWFLRKIREKCGCLPLPIVEIEYHRPTGGFSANIVRPIPAELRTSRLLIVEDVFDSGGVANAMRLDAPNCTIVTVVRKRVPKQLQVPGVYSAVDVDDVWLGGVGMEMVDSRVGELVRDFGTLFAKPRTETEAGFQNPFTQVVH